MQFSETAQPVALRGTCDCASIRDRAQRDVSKLTLRESRVLALLVEGYKNADIARELYLSDSTVHDDVSRILKKLSCENRTQAAVIGYQAGVRRSGR